jgi:hypothetical protein
MKNEWTEAIDKLRQELAECKAECEQKQIWIDLQTNVLKTIAENMQGGES